MQRIRSLEEFARAYVDPDDEENFVKTFEALIAGFDQHPDSTGAVIFECADLGSPNIGQRWMVLCAPGDGFNFAHPQDAEGKQYLHWSNLPKFYYLREGVDERTEQTPAG